MTYLKLFVSLFQFLIVCRKSSILAFKLLALLKKILVVLDDLFRSLKALVAKLEQSAHDKRGHESDLTYNLVLDLVRLFEQFAARWPIGASDHSPI